MHDALHIRPATRLDLASVLGLYRHLSPEDVLPEGEAAEAIWTRVLDAPGVTPLVGTVQGDVVATCILVMVPNLTRGGRAFAFIENVVTHPAYRRRGYGGVVGQLLQGRALNGTRRSAYTFILRKDWFQARDEDGVRDAALNPSVAQ